MSEENMENLLLNKRILELEVRLSKIDMEATLLKQYVDSSFFVKRKMSKSIGSIIELTKGRNQ